MTAIWGSAWRADQKERELRERIISESLGVALRNHPCIQSVKLHPRDSNAEGSSTLDSSLHETDVVLFFLFEEAGPNLSFYLSPILWDTNNHVRYRLHAIDTKNSDAVFLGAIDWRRGGPFTFNSTAHLDADIQTAVTYALDRVFDNPDDTESGEHRVQ